MKIFKKIRMFTLCMLLLNIVSCSSEFRESGVTDNSMKLPIISSVTEAFSKQNVATGVTGRIYFIKGENLQNTTDIKFNGFSANINPTYVTKNTVIVTIPFGTPFLKISETEFVPNKLVLSTTAGDAEFDFSILSIESFSEGVQSGKNVVTLNGGDFTDVTRVVFTSGSEALGNLEERDATILEIEKGAVTAEVPDGVIQAFISVYIDNVVAVANDSYGFNYPLFTDQLFGWNLGGWSGAQSVVDGENSIGNSSVRRDSDGFGGLTFTIGDGADDLFYADYRTVTFQVYPANTETTKVKFVLNDDFDSGIILDLVPLEWNKFVIPLKDLIPTGDAPVKITRMDFQEFSGGTAPFLFYIDQFGLIE